MEWDPSQSRKEDGKQGEFRDEKRKGAEELLADLKWGKEKPTQLLRQ